MAKEDDVVAAAMAKPIREGYPILTEEHPFFGKLRAFTNKKTHWLGTATDLLNSYYDKLSQMTAKQRMNYFKYEQFVEPLRYTQDVDNTTYVVRTHFDENADKTILQRIEHLVEKDSI